MLIEYSSNNQVSTKRPGIPEASGEETAAERVVEAVVDDERETLGEVLAESVIGLSKDEMSGKGKKNKKSKKRRKATKGSKEGKAERVRAGDKGQHPGAGTNHDAQGRDPKEPPEEGDSKKPPEDGDSNKLPEEGQQPSDKAWDSFI